MDADRAVSDLNFAPDTSGAWLIVAASNAAGTDIGRRRDFKVLGWTRQDGNIVPVVVDETSAQTFIVDWETLSLGYLAFEPQVIRVDAEDDNPLGESFTREPHWGGDFDGNDRDGVAVADNLDDLRR